MIKQLSRNTPLRVQLVLVVLVLVTLALFTTSIASSSLLRGYLLKRVDGQLGATSRAQMERLTGLGLGRGPGGPGDGRDGPALSSAFFAVVVDGQGNGDAQLRTPIGVEQSEPRLPALTTQRVNKLTGHPFTVPARSKGYQWRILVSELPNDAGAVVVGTSLNDVDNTLDRLQAVNLSVGGLVLLCLGMIGYWLVSTRLRRLVEVEETTERIAAGDLTQRVPNANDRTEVGRLATAVNTMLTQIESAFSAQRTSEEEARASESRMRRFIADASHELRTPLTSIRGFSELHRQGEAIGQKPAVDLMARIEGEAKRMGVLVDDLLLLARLDQQRPLDAHPVELNELISDVVSDAPLVAPDHPVSLHVSDEAAHAVVVGEGTRLRQVFANLMTNAYTHTPPGTQVAVTLERVGDQAVVTIADNGPGMPAEDAARVFERFYRSDPSRTRTSGGSGLGLSIAKGIVRAHGGDIELETAPGEGAKFAVTLPLQDRTALDSDSTTAPHEEAVPNPVPPA